MSEPLITKYRPTKWDQVVGQDQVVKALKKAIEKGRSHAFLFHGPSGTGKTTLARIAAMAAGSGVGNITEVDGATYTGIDSMRELTTALQYRPLGGGVHSIIVDECHALSASAWKAILKSVEEPPSWVYWFLCTTELGKVPKTIATRCTSLKLREVEQDKLYDLLVEICDSEKLNLSEDIVSLCAKKAQGSPRQAITNLATCAEAKNTSEGRLLLEEAEGKEEIIALARALLRRASWWEVQKILAGLKDENGESVRHVVRAYMTTVALSAKKEQLIGRCIEVLDCFSEPFPSGDGFSPVVLACGKLCLGA